MSLQELDYVVNKLQWMEEKQIWPNGLRYLWTDAFGLVLYLSLYRLTSDYSYLNKAERLVDDVYLVLGRDKGLRIGEAADRDGQYFHYLAMWMYALTCLGKIKPQYKALAIRLVKEVHPHFVVPGMGVIWKMEEDLSGPYPGYGLGAMDAYNAYVVYRLLDEKLLADEIAEMKDLVDAGFTSLEIDQDLGLGMMLWLCHFFPGEDWAGLQRLKSEQHLNRLWIESPGYFCRQSHVREMKFAFTNYGISLGLQACGLWPERVKALNAFFERYRSHDEYDSNAITHVMACTSHFPGLFLKKDS